MRPFLKWAGGKRWLTPLLSNEFPKSYNRYIEPFLGGGAVFFHVSPKAAILADVNEALIEVYVAVRDHPNSVLHQLEIHQLQHSNEHYYRTRSTIPDCPIGRAARFIYLNRTCWNGLYRVNKRGEFNVPKGTKDTVIFDGEDFGAISERLSKAQLCAQDFEKTLEIACEGDLVYVDPPYTVKHNNNGFVKYNEKIFSWDDQVRLYDACKKAADRGAKVFVSNADHDSLRAIYAEAGLSVSIERASVLASKSAARQRVTELLVQIR